MYYANAELLSEEITELVNEATPPVSWFCIDADAVDDVDFSAAETLRSVQDLLKGKGIRLVFAIVSDDVKGELDRYGLTDLVGEDAFYATGDDLLSAFHQNTNAKSEI